MGTPHWNGDELSEAAGTSASDQIPLSADVFQTRTTRAASAAGDLRVDCHATPDQELSELTPSGDDFSSQFVPHDERRLAALAARSNALQIRSADSGGLDSEQHLVGGRRRSVDVANLKVKRLRVEKRPHRTVARLIPLSPVYKKNVRSLYIPRERTMTSDQRVCLAVSYVS
jgi:hypothetical protein